MNQANSEVQKFFDALSDEYTATIERCFPRYREMLWSLLEYLPKRRFESILELGAGTGNLTVLLSEAFPQSRITAVDLSGESLSVCGSRVGEDTDLRCDQRDFRQLEYPPGSFDLVVSSIAIHHLTSSEKQLIFDRIETWLSPEGVFSYADQFRGATDDIYACHMANWKSQSLAAGSSEAEFEMWMQHQREHDYHDTLQDQLNWLVNAGFQHVDCHWRYLLWSVVQARKTTSSESL